MVMAGDRDSMLEFGSWLETRFIFVKTLFIRVKTLPGFRLVLVVFVQSHCTVPMGVTTIHFGGDVSPPILEKYQSVPPNNRPIIL